MEQEKPTILSSEIVYENPRFRVREDRLRFPNDHIDAFYLVEGPPFVIILAVRDDRIALVRQYRHAVGVVTTEAPKGVVEAGESPEVAAERELREEVGCRASRLDLLATLPAALSNLRRTGYVFRATNLIDQVLAVQKDATEFDLHAVWMLIKEFRALIRAGEILDRDTLAAWAVYLESGAGETLASS